MEQKIPRIYLSGIPFQVTAICITAKTENAGKIRVRLGSYGAFYIDSIEGLSIPETVELYLMEYELLPSWFWNKSLISNPQNPMYFGEFAHRRNKKTEVNCSAESTNTWR